MTRPDGVRRDRRRRRPQRARRGGVPGQGRALAVLVLERARSRRWGATITEELAPGVRVPALAHTVGRLRPVRRPRARALAARAGAHGPGRAGVRPAAGRPRGALWTDVAATADALRALVGPTTPSPTWSSTGASGSSPASSRTSATRTPPDDQGARLRRRLMGLRWAARSRASARTTGARSCGSCRWRSRTSSASRSRRRRSGPTLAWRGRPYTAMGPMVGGHDQRPPRRLRRERRRRGRRDGLRAGRPLRARRCPGAAIIEAGGEIRTGAGHRVTSRDGRRDGRRPGRPARRLRPRVDRVRSGSEAPAHELVDPVALGPSLRWRASNIRTPGTVAKVNLALDGLPASRPRGRWRACSAAGSRWGRPASTPSSGPSMPRSTANLPRRRSWRRRSRRSWTRRSSPGRPTGRTS
jgi:hypothetical protein